MSAPMKPSDPAYWLLERGLNNPSNRTVSDTYDENCYICRDPEFALMGLPLCFACEKCQAHVAADDGACGKCGHDGYQEDDREP